MVNFKNLGGFRIFGDYDQADQHGLRTIAKAFHSYDVKAKTG